jgi:hypothetical protein
MCVKESVDDKVIKDKMLEEVQRTKLLMHNPVINGRDMNREPPSTSIILDQALAIYINSKYLLMVVFRFWKFIKIGHHHI